MEVFVAADDGGATGGDCAGEELVVRRILAHRFRERRGENHLATQSLLETMARGGSSVDADAVRTAAASRMFKP